MRRRAFTALLGGLALALPLWAQAQQRMPVVGFISSGSRSPIHAEAFARGLQETGYVAGRNVAIEFRWADNRNDRLPELAADLVSRQVDVIAAAGAAAFAAKRATETIPVVFLIDGDPVGVGLATSFNRPGGNATGIILLTGITDAKRIELLREALPAVRVVGVLIRKTPQFENRAGQLRAAARALGLEAHVEGAATESEIEAAFAIFAKRGVGGLVVPAEPLFASSRAKIRALSEHHRLPSIHPYREWALAGLLMSYGPSQIEAARVQGVYVGRILKGAKPGELPIQRPTKFELVINLKTAKALGLTVPPTLLARADEVIE